MKMQDLISSVSIAIIGTILAYFLMNSLLGDPKEKTVSFEYLTGASSDLAEPDDEIFNSGAINPTVEVYIGSCVDRNQDGLLDEAELVECGQAQSEINTGVTSSDDYLYENNGLSNDENEEINRQNGYANGTTADQREAVEQQINDYANQQQNQQTNGGEEIIDYNNPDRQQTVSPTGN